MQQISKENNRCFTRTFKYHGIVIDEFLNVLNVVKISYEKLYIKF